LGACKYRYCGLCGQEKLAAVLRDLFDCAPIEIDFAMPGVAGDHFAAIPLHFR